MIDGFMAGCCLLVPAIVLIAGRIMWKHPPQEINAILGYRISLSMKNQDTWAFAHDYCGRLWWKIGWILLAATLLALIPLWSCSDTVVGVAGTVIMLVQCVVLIASIFPTERALKRTFNDDGTRRKKENQF